MATRDCAAPSMAPGSRLSRGASWPSEVTCTGARNEVAEEAVLDAVGSLRDRELRSERTAWVCPSIQTHSKPNRAAARSWKWSRTVAPGLTPGLALPRHDTGWAG